MATLAVLLTDAGILVDGSIVPGDYPIELAQAAWNYVLIMEDNSKGIHNPTYASTLIKNSIEALNAN